MKLKTADLTPLQLDWLVATIEKVRCFSPERHGWRMVPMESREDFYSPSSDWSQGGPIIERHIFRLEDHGDPDLPDQWVAIGLDDVTCYGPTPLVAVMRCYVASRLGDEVDVPVELT